MPTFFGNQIRPQVQPSYGMRQPMPQQRPAMPGGFPMQQMGGAQQFAARNAGFGQNAPARQMPMGGAMGQGQNMAPMLGAQQAMSRAMPNMLSDERSKQTIEDLRSRLKDLGDQGAFTPAEANAFRDVQNHSYEYRPEFRGEPGAAPGRHVGPMAQELEGIPGVVDRRPDGMREVNTPRLTMATAGEVGQQRRELDALRARLADLEGNPDAVLDVAGGRR